MRTGRGWRSADVLRKFPCEKRLSDARRWRTTGSPFVRSGRPYTPVYNTYVFFNYDDNAVDIHGRELISHFVDLEKGRSRGGGGRGRSLRAILRAVPVH